MPLIGDQYRIITTGAGWRLRRERGRIRFSGADRLAYLQALLTNDVASLSPGAGVYAAYLTPQGRMIADLNVYVRAADVIAAVPADIAARLATTFDQLIFAEQVQVDDVTHEYAQVTVVGGAAASAAAGLFGLAERDLASLATWSHVDAGGGFVAKSDDATLPSFDLFVPAAQRQDVVTKLSASAIEIDDELWTALRIEAGRPLFGVDMDTETIPLEAGLLDRAISTTKGCYVGQEVVIRVLHRGAGRVARRLARLILDGDITGLHEGATLRADGRDVGRITSMAPTTDGSGIQALGYVHRDFAEPGRRLELGTSSTGGATITKLAG